MSYPKYQQERIMYYASEYTNQNHEITLYTHSNHKDIILSVGRICIWRKWKNYNPHILLMGNAKWCSCCGKWHSCSLAIPQKLEIELPYDPAISFLGIYYKQIKNRDSNKYLDTNVYSSTIHNRQKVEQLKCPSLDDLIYKM